MNQAQLKYAKERLAAAKSEKEKKLGYRYNWGYTTEQKEALFKEGKYKVVNRDGSFTIVWDGEEAHRKGQEKLFSELEIQYRKALDELMLGDNAMALELINNYIGE